MSEIKMDTIDPAEFEKRLVRIGEIFTEISHHADQQALSRCPYKNRLDQCTAKFACRNQGKPPTKGGLLECTGDDKLDYRSAWESA